MPPVPNSGGVKPLSKMQLQYEEETPITIEARTQPSSSSSRRLIIYVNGKARDTSNIHPQMTLLTYLREELGLTGSKLGCGEGGCGACTVMISRLEADTGVVRHRSVNACLMPVCACHCSHVTTVEGIGNVHSMHKIQQRMVDLHGSQCGYCTPGIVMAIFANMVNGENMVEHMDGNLCRCTGYRPIWDAIKTLDPENSGCGGCSTVEDCASACGGASSCNGDSSGGCSSGSTGCGGSSSVVTSSTSDKVQMYKDASTEKSDAQQERLLQKIEYVLTHSDNVAAMKGSLSVVDVGGKMEWVQPSSLQELLEIIHQSSSSKIIAGNTEVGIEIKFKHRGESPYATFVNPSSVCELYGITEDDTHTIVGANMDLSSLSEYCHKQKQEGRLTTHSAITNMLRWFASTQIRNVACLAGNLATASPISDMNPLLASMGAALVIASSAENGELTTRKVPVEEFFMSYRKVNLNQGEIITQVLIPHVAETFEYVMPFKQARRREDDISIVTSGMRIKLKPSVDDSRFVVEDASFAFGGMAPTTISAPKTASFLIGKDWPIDLDNENLFTLARRELSKELTLPDDVPGGQAEYRRALASSFLFKFFINVSLAIGADVEKLKEKHIVTPPAPRVPDEHLSAATSFVETAKPSIEGTQSFPAPKFVAGLEKTTEKQKKLPPVVDKHKNIGTPSTHASAAMHCSGEAIYVDDIPKPARMLHAVLLLSDRANCRLVGVDKTAALEVEGVVDVVTYEDLLGIGGSNKLGPVVKDEEVFSSGSIRNVGTVIGVAVAETLEAAQAAVNAVIVSYAEYGDGRPTIISIQDAIRAGSYYEMTRHKLVVGDVEDALASEGAVTVSGEFNVAGQEHFYLESNSTLVIPTEDKKGFDIFSSTQAVTKTQMCCASATGSMANRVTVKTKRLGGGFGGKETRNVFSAAAAAVAAKITGRPVRLTLDRNVDMQTTGQRHAFYAKYKASATIDPDTGVAKLGALDVKLFSNAGCALDLSGPVLDRALFHIDGAYKWSAFRAEGVCCKTDQPPHTAFRGFGGPQGIVICENIVDHLASAMDLTGRKLDEFRRANMYKEGDHTHFGQEILHGTWNVPTAWDNLTTSANVENRRLAVAEYNRVTKWKKRGISILPTKFGIAFTAKFMNQGGALVHVYTDGTVLVSHGGTEMGQGLHTKVAQVAACAFGIPLSDVHVCETASDKVANSNPSAASMSTDMYGMATLNACNEILNNLLPVRNRLGSEASLKEVATAAFFERIDLSAHGFFRLADERCGFDWNASAPPGYDGPPNQYKGHPFNYFTQGVAVSEVEVDLLTGDHRILRADVLVDVGSSINPAIDVGQIEGAFTQGVGWCTIEEMIWGDSDHSWVRPAGRLFTQGPGAYKLPSFNDTPEIFNVKLMDGVANPFVVHSSKGIGEPPFFLGCTVFFAIKEALRDARIELLGEMKGRRFDLMLPATSERIRMSVGDEICRDGIVGTIFDENVKLHEEKLTNFQPKGSF